MNLAYIDYPSIIKSGGFNGYPKPTAESKKQSPTAKKSVDELAKEVLAGKWGNGTTRKQNLTKAGYDYDAVQKKVNQLVK